MTILQALSGVRRLFLDTAPVIYYVQANPTYLTRVRPIFQAASPGNLELVASPITLAESLVLPIRQSQVAHVQAFVALLTNPANTTFVSLDHCAQQAAEIRAQYNLQLADSFQVAAAVRFGCDLLVTNDGHFRRVREIPVLILDDLQP